MFRLVDSHQRKAGDGGSSPHITMRRSPTVAYQFSTPNGRQPCAGNIGGQYINHRFNHGTTWVQWSTVTLTTSATGNTASRPAKWPTHDACLSRFMWLHLSSTVEFFYWGALIAAQLIAT